MEELLNKLIEKGWKPRGEKVNKVIKTGIDEFGDGYVLFDGELNGYKQRGCNMVELVSKSSGLWQFVCKNGYNQYKKNYFHWFSKYGLKGEYWDTSDFEYYVLEAALIDESELEEFLLSNIKIDDK